MTALIRKIVFPTPPSIPEIVNNLASDATDKTLAASQGKALAQTIAELNNLSLSTVVNTIYPVGSIIEFSNYLDPNTVFAGTTWAEYGQGRVTVAQGDDFATLGAIGGQKSVKMTSGMLIEHSHKRNSDGVSENIHTGIGGGAAGDWSGANGYIHGYQDTGKTGNADPDPIPTMSPYVVVKRWRRTA